MTREDIYLLLERLDNDCEILSIRHKDTVLWLYARLGLYFKLIQKNAPTATESSQKKSFSFRIFFLFLVDLFFSRKKKYTHIFVSLAYDVHDIAHKNDKLYPFLKDLQEEGNTLFLLSSTHYNTGLDYYLDANLLHRITKIGSLFVIFNMISLIQSMRLAFSLHKKTSINFFMLFFTVLKSISFYTAQHWIFRRILKKIQPETIFFTDFCSYLGALRAAHHLKIVSIDLQHGMFGAHDPTYRWPSFYAEPLLPKVCVMHGEWWKKIALNTKAWEDENIFIYAPQDIFSNNQEKSRKNMIVWATQWTARAHSVTFLNLLLEEIQKNKLSVKICIKLHPADRDFQSAYERIQRTFPHYCFIARAEEDIYSLMKKALLTVSYGSTVILESLAMRTPSVSLCCVGMEKGFAGLFHLYSLQKTVPHIQHPHELIDIIQKNILQKDVFEKWQQDVFMLSQDFYTQDSLSLYQRMKQWNLI